MAAHLFMVQRKSAKGLVYSACAAALMDLDNPNKVLARLPYALFSPEMSLGN